MIFIEDGVPIVKYNGLNTNQPATFGHGTLAVNSTATSVTLTAAQVALGYILNKGSTVTMTLPTGTLLGNYLGATQGTTFDLFIDNTYSSIGTVTVAVATNGILSDAANTTSASFGQLTIKPSPTGIAKFSIMFTSATTYVFTRTA